MEGKELAEYVIKRIVDGDVFFAGNSDAISFMAVGSRGRENPSPSGRG